MQQRPRLAHTEPPVPPPTQQPDEPERPPPLPPDSPFPGKPHTDPPRSPPDQPLEPPPPIVADRTAAAIHARAAIRGFLLTLVPLVFATSVAAGEEVRPQDRAATFRQLDIDGDGWISSEEASANAEVAANFEKADRDQDGKLSPEEFEGIALNRSDQPGKFRNPERG